MGSGSPELDSTLSGVGALTGAVLSAYHTFPTLSLPGQLQFILQDMAKYLRSL